MGTRVLTNSTLYLLYVNNNKPIDDMPILEGILSLFKNTYLRMYLDQANV